MGHHANHSRSRRGLLLLILPALVLVTLASAAVGTLGWLRFSRSLQTITQIQIPVLSIHGSAQDILAMNLGDIDVTTGTQREYVFGIKSDQDAQYQLQLAHTTNIPFTYTIYPAAESNSPPDGLYMVESGKYYSYDTPLSGGYLNMRNGIATNQYHADTYGSYSEEHVQERAQPLYWQSADFTFIPSNQINYYVLVVSWNPPLKNDKETDMVYLTVSTGGV